MVLALAAVLVSLIPLSFLLPSHLPEPSYAGKTLTQWLVNTDTDWIWIPNDVYGHIHNELWDAVCDTNSTANSCPPGSWTPPPPDEVRQAVTQIGTNAIPRLLQLMASKDTRWTKTRNAIAERLPDKLGRLIYPYHFPDLVDRQHAAAFEGFSILGTNAEPALPALSNMLFHGDPDLELTWAIANIGPKGIALLTSALARTNADRRNDIALALGLEYRAARSAGPALVDRIERGDANYDVLGALGRIGSDDPRLVPALTRLLQATNADDNPRLHTDMAYLVLGLQREKARAAAPLVIAQYRLLTGDAEAAAYRRFYRRILRNIAPDLETNLPPRQPDEYSSNWP